MPGSQTTRSRSHARAGARGRVAFRWSVGVGAPIEAFAAQWLAYTFPCRRFASGLAADPRTARGRCGSLRLHRSGLAPPTPCRSPGAPDPNYLNYCQLLAFALWSDGDTGDEYALLSFWNIDSR